MDETLYYEHLKFLKFSSTTRARYYNSSHQDTNDEWISADELIPRLSNDISIQGPNQALISSSEAKGNAPFILIALRGISRHTPLSIEKPHFIQLLDLCQFPQAFIQATCANNGQFAHFHEFEDSQEEPFPSFLSVVVQSPHSPAKNFSCVLRTQVGNRSTICLLINEDEIRINTLIDRLRGRRKLLEKSPLYFIILLVEDYGYANEKLRESLDQSIFDMECYIRTATFYMGALDENSEALQTLIVKLHVTKNRLVWLDCTTNFELELGTFSQEMIELYENLRRIRKLDIRSKPDRILLSQETNFHQNACRFRRYQAQGLQQRVQTQINILYSQISQRDNRLNISVARDSRKIAKATQEDSKIMKTIAFLTLFFLPSTLVASIYSSGIFDFQTNNVSVSSLWWTYAVSSVVLTLIVLAIWGFYWHIRSKTSD